MQAVENLTKYSTSTECFRYLLKHEGIGGLYNGLEAQMWRNGIWNGLYFGTVGTVQIFFPPAPEASHGEKLFYKFSTGVVGSMLGTIANTPFDVVKSRMQQQTKPTDGSPAKYRNTLQSLGVVAKEEGTAALYKGLVPRLVRLGPGGGIMIVAFDTISGWLQKF
jgi:solute carrier family 25 2-oxodicarboxylate transporter 21